MQNTRIQENYDVIISGAGPAGAVCALQLRNSGLRVAVFDKAAFPRDKVCGDAIPGRAVSVLNSLDPSFAAAFRSFALKRLIRKTRIHYGVKSFSHQWVREAYTCARVEFDHFLYSLLRQHAGAEIFPAVPVQGVKVSDDHVAVTLGGSGQEVTAQVVVAADGAHSVVARNLTGVGIDRRHHVASVRAYYSGVAMADPEQTEVFLDKRFFPGYFWLFPLAGNQVNAGFGMLSGEVARRKINVRAAFESFIQLNPVLKERFQGAQRTGGLEGFGLPLGSRRLPLSGNRFLLTGDAASLIDPVSGDGIGNAMLSGMLAARQILKSFPSRDFSASAMQPYDRSLHHAIGRELRVNTLLLRTGTRLPFLLDLAFLVRR